jgi:Ca2+-binding EF-hand superfamily protein
MEDMRNVWSVFDIDGTGQVSVMELRTILRALDIDPSEDELESIYNRVDTQGTGMFTFESLNEVMEDKLKDVDTLEDLMEQLKKLDKDKDGRIPNPEFK